MKTRTKISLVWVAFIAVLNVPAHQVRAEGDVVLSEVIPELLGTDAGAIVVTEAPPSGASRKVTRRQVNAALERAGLDPAQFDLPRAFIVSRRSRLLDKDELGELVRTPLAGVLSPCDVLDVSAPGVVRVPEGSFDVLVERRPLLRTGRLTVIVTLDAGGSTIRVPISAQLSCPPPAVAPGASVQLVVQVGAVRATTEGIAYQSGHVGDVVRVRNSATGTMMRGRVIDAHRVEVQR